jgi:hypothetical protein
MSIPADLRRIVRERANFACEYCGVSEIDAGGELTIDHVRPRSHGGAHLLDNLVYCCQRCNSYKADYFTAQPDVPQLWNPRVEPFAANFLVLDDGTLHPLSSTGAFTLRRLRLNRAQLVAYRQRRREWSERAVLLEQYADLLSLLERLSQQQAVLLSEQRALLVEQRALIDLLLDRGND